MNFLKKIFGDENKRKLATLYPIVEKINSLEKDFVDFREEDFKKKTLEFKDRLKNKEILDDILPEAFALVRQASKKTLNQRHFDVQLLGGIVLHQGGIAEMRTGEGKTLVATLPAYLNALTGEGVHIVTVNDYLSRRDAVWMGQIYSLLGLSVGVINHDESFLYNSLSAEELDKRRDETGSFKVVDQFLITCSRKEAYLADITYGTNNEFGFDYLRDNIEYSPEKIRQRKYNYAIVDEIDSILIDEARTPLIISAPTSESEDLYLRFAKLVEKLEKGTDYEVDEKLRAITLTEEGINKSEKILGISNIYTEHGIKYVHHLESAVKAKAIFNKDVDYVVKNGEIIIVDPFTGRLQPGRRWSEGLHQAIEAKEGVDVQKESKTFASITFQNYFRLYKKLSGMTGTAITSSEEFYKVYNLDCLSVPTNKPVQRTDHDDLIFQTEVGKFKSVARKVKELNKNGQPVLIGTASVEKNELLSSFLTNEGIVHEVLNAKNHEREGEIISQAGKYGSVTIATNMAGRGVDIKLGGNPGSGEDYEKIKNLGGLFVLGTERHEARRIDNQLRGRSGRQGDPGDTQFFVSLEDNLMRVFASDTLKNMMGRFGIPEDEPIKNRIITKSLESAQEKIEGFHFDSRKHVLDFDNVLNHQRKIVYERRRKILTGGVGEVKEYLESIENIPEDVLKIIEKKENELGKEEFTSVFKRLILQTIDFFWMDHLEMMDYTRSSVNLRAYGQRDPLVEYKKEGLRLFKEMEESIREEIVKLIPNMVTGAFEEEYKRLKEISNKAVAITGSDKAESSSSKKLLDSSGNKVGRNDPCPCGSGKKYKNCHAK